MIAVPIALRYQGAGCLAITPSTGAIVCVACGTPATGDGTECCVTASPHFVPGEHAQLLSLAALPQIVTGLLALVHIEARAIALALDAHAEAGRVLDDIAVVVLAAGHTVIDARLADAIGPRAALSVKSREAIVASASVTSPAVGLLLARAPEPNRAWAWVRDGRVELVALLGCATPRGRPVTLLGDSGSTRATATPRAASAGTATEPLDATSPTAASASPSDADENVIHGGVR